jgi:hypothetical protein
VSKARQDPVWVGRPFAADRVTAGATTLEHSGLGSLALMNGSSSWLVPPRRINKIVLGKRAVTAGTALRLARYLRPVLAESPGST